MGTIIKSAFKRLKEHKISFTSIILLQLLFFSSMGIVLFTYSQSIVGPLQSINDNIMSQEWMQEMPTEENLKELNIPSTNVAAIEAEKRKMANATIKLYISIIAFFILFQGVAWALSYRIASKRSWKESAVDFGKFSVVALFALLALFILIHSAVILLTDQFFTPNASQTYLFMLPLFVAVLLSYFIPIAFALTGTAPLKEILQKTIQTGMRKCLFLFSFYGMYALTLIVLAIALTKSAGVSFPLSIVIGIMLLSCIAFSRIMLIQGLHEKN